MPLTYTIDPSRRTIFTHVTGVLTETEYNAARELLRVDPNFDPTFAQYMDLREARDIAFSSDTMASISAHSLFHSGVKRAFLAETPFQFGMARMFGFMSEMYNQNVRVFRDQAAAEAWLWSQTDP